VSRQTRIRRAAVSFVLSAMFLGAPASAQSADEEELSSWLPSLGISFDVHTQNFDISGSSDLGYADQQTENVLTSVFSVDAGVSTPTLLEGFGAPRIFVQAGIQAPLSDEFAGLSSVASFPPFSAPPMPGIPSTEEACPATGDVIDTGTPPLVTLVSCDQTLNSTLTYNFSWSAGIGAEFTLPTPSRAFKIRTAVEYFGQSFDFEGDAQRDDRAGGSSPLTNGRIVQTLRIEGAKTSKTLHSIGPRITVAGEVGRAGPLSFAVFAETRLYWLLNDGDITYGAMTPDGNSSFVAEPDSLVAQGGAGLRITWVGSR
jgi:hypothetical protein